MYPQKMLEKQERRAAYEAMEKQKKLMEGKVERKLQGWIKSFQFFNESLGLLLILSLPPFEMIVTCSIFDSFRSSFV